MNEIAIADPSALTVHPAAALFPLLDEQQLRELADDIAANGLVSPIVVKGDQLLDGRNRLRACELAGIAPRFLEWTGTGSITAWIFSMNLRRRHLSTSQRAMLAARAIDVFAVEAKERMDLGVAVEGQERTTARERAAEQTKVGQVTVQLAKTVLTKGAPELVAAVDAGEVAVTTAADLATLPVDEQRTVVREKKTAERAKEVREQRRPAPRPPPPMPPSVPPPPPPPRSPPPSPPRSAPAAPPSLSAAPSRPQEDEGPEEHSVDEDDDDRESTLDPRNRPDPQPVPLTAFKAGYRRGTSPKDEAAKVDQILAALTSAVHAWQWIFIEWNEDKRGDMRFALHESRELCLHFNQAVAKLQMIADFCHGRLPAPTPEGR